MAKLTETHVNRIVELKNDAQSKYSYRAIRDVLREEFPELDKLVHTSVRTAYEKYLAFNRKQKVLSLLTLTRAVLADYSTVNHDIFISSLEEKCSDEDISFNECYHQVIGYLQAVSIYSGGNKLTRTIDNFWKENFKG